MKKNRKEGKERKRMEHAGTPKIADKRDQLQDTRTPEEIGGSHKEFEMPIGGEGCG